MLETFLAKEGTLNRKEPSKRYLEMLLRSLVKPIIPDELPRGTVRTELSLQMSVLDVINISLTGKVI